MLLPVVAAAVALGALASGAGRTVGRRGAFDEGCGCFRGLATALNIGRRAELLARLRTATLVLDVLREPNEGSRRVFFTAARGFNGAALISVREEEEEAAAAAASAVVGGDALAG